MIELVTNSSLFVLSELASLYVSELGFISAVEIASGVFFYV